MTSLNAVDPEVPPLSDAPRPLMQAEGLERHFGKIAAVDGVSLKVFPGEILAIVGESGSGKTTLLRCLAGEERLDSGHVSYDLEGRGLVRLADLDEAKRRILARSEWGFIHQNPRDGLRLAVSAGGNIGERMMMAGRRHYGEIRQTAEDWMRRVEMAPERIDDKPRGFSGGMQQRLQIARNLVSGPRLVFMDEPTGGLDVSVQARLLDLLRALSRDLGLAVVLVTHDLGVARMLADRLLVMRQGRIVEEGLTDQVLDDPQHPYSQLLVASVLRA